MGGQCAQYPCWGMGRGWVACWHTSVVIGVVQIGLPSSTFLGNVRLGQSSLGGGVVHVGHLHSSTLLGSVRLGLLLGPVGVQLGVGHLLSCQPGLSSHLQSWARPGVRLGGW